MTETEFLRQYDPDRYEKPAVTVDMLIFTVNPERDYSLELLMIERGSSLSGKVGTSRRLCGNE